MNRAGAAAWAASYDPARRPGLPVRNVWPICVPCGGKRQRLYQRPAAFAHWEAFWSGALHRAASGGHSHGYPVGSPKDHL